MYGGSSRGVMVIYVPRSSANDLTLIFCSRDRLSVMRLAGERLALKREPALEDAETAVREGESVFLHVHLLAAGSKVSSGWEAPSHLQ